MLFIFIVPSFLASCLPHALPCTVLQLQKSRLWPALPSATFTSFPRAAAGGALGCTEHPPLCSEQRGSLLTMEQSFVGARRSTGLLACRLSLQPCRHKLLICSHLHGTAAADGASKLAAVADSYMPRVRHVSSTHHYFSCHRSC